MFEVLVFKRGCKLEGKDQGYDVLAFWSFWTSVTFWTLVVLDVGHFRKLVSSRRWSVRGVGQFGTLVILEPWRFHNVGLSLVRRVLVSESLEHSIVYHCLFYQGRYSIHCFIVFALVGLLENIYVGKKVLCHTNSLNCTPHNRPSSQLTPVKNS